MNQATTIAKPLNQSYQENTMIVFSKDRKDAIYAFKALIKSGDQRLSHEHYVLYAALRGQDIRKTSHMPQGENAVAALEKLKKWTEYYKHKAHFFFMHLKTVEGEPMFKQDRASWVLEILEEAKAITELTPTANDGVNTMAMN